MKDLLQAKVEECGLKYEKITRESFDGASNMRANLTDFVLILKTTFHIRFISGVTFTFQTFPLCIPALQQRRGISSEP